MNNEALSIASKGGAMLAVYEIVNGRIAGALIMFALFFVVRILAPPIPDPPDRE